MKKKPLGDNLEALLDQGSPLDQANSESPDISPQHTKSPANSDKDHIPTTAHSLLLSQRNENSNDFKLLLDVT